MATISIIAPSPLIGSGGVARIYGFAKHLVDRGHRCVVQVFDSNGRAAGALRDDCRKFYGFEVPEIMAVGEYLGHSDLAIATRWDTARIVRDAPNTVHRAYLIQDYEATFNALGDGTIAAENSYLYGLQPITYGNWLALKLRSEFGLNPMAIQFASNLRAFTPLNEYAARLSGPPSVCFIYQPDKPRRCPWLGIEALGIVKHYRPDVAIRLVGNPDPPKIWYEVENLGILSESELNEAYNTSTIGLCLSPSNPSCNPFDMMAAGLPSVDLYRENNLFDIPSGGVFLAHQAAESIAEAILFLLSDPERLQRMSALGLSFMKDRHRDQEAVTFEQYVDSILAGRIVLHDYNRMVNAMYSLPPYVARAFRNDWTGAMLAFQRNRMKAIFGVAVD